MELIQRKRKKERFKLDRCPFCGNERIRFLYSLRGIEYFMCPSCMNNFSDEKERQKEEKINKPQRA
jgi:transposase-like protein